MSMFDLTDAHVRQLIFAVENKKVTLLVDLATGNLEREEDVPEEHRPVDRATIDIGAPYAYPPDWTSADGFALMDRFAANEVDPAVAAKLRSALDSGRGVFRAFKDVLRLHPEAEQRWQTFKTRELRDLVYDWYNTLREVRGLDTVERGVDEEFDDLVGEAFTVDHLAGEPQGEISELVTQSYAEIFTGIPERVAQTLQARYISAVPSGDGAEHHVLVARGPDGRCAGFLWYHLVANESSERIRTLELVFVDVPFRGLGIGTHLAETFLVHAREAGDHVVIQSPGGAQWFRHRFPTATVRETGSILYLES